MSVQVSKVSLASSFVASWLYEREQFITLALVAATMDADPVKLVEFMAGVIATIEETEDDG